MSLNAVGEYLRVLREDQSMSRNALGRLVKTDHSQIERIEKGQIDTRGSHLLAIVHAVGGSAEQLTELMNDKSATAEDGRRLAEAWLNGGKQAATPLPTEIETLAHELAGDPLRLRQWIGYGVRLLDEMEQAVSVGGRGEG